jgi:hypothetical protein
MKTNIGSTYSTLTAAQREALIRRGHTLRAEAFAHVLSAIVRPFAGHAPEHKDASRNAKAA